MCCAYVDAGCRGSRSVHRDLTVTGDAHACLLSIGRNRCNRSASARSTRRGVSATSMCTSNNDSESRSLLNRCTTIELFPCPLFSPPHRLPPPQKKHCKYFHTPLSLSLSPRPLLPRARYSRALLTPRPYMQRSQNFPVFAAAGCASQGQHKGPVRGARALLS